MKQWIIMLVAAALLFGCNYKISEEAVWSTVVPGLDQATITEMWQPRYGPGDKAKEYEDGSVMVTDKNVFRQILLKYKKYPVRLVLINNNVYVSAHDRVSGAVRYTYKFANVLENVERYNCVVRAQGDSVVVYEQYYSNSDSE